MAELEKLLCTDSKVESLKKINAIIEKGGDELNNPFSLLDYKYSEYELNNISWLRSNGQWNSKAVYPAVYDLLLKIYNGTETKAGVSVKLSTGSYTDYDFVLNTAEETFRLPLLDGSENIADYTTKITQTALPIQSNSFTAPSNGIYVASFSGEQNSTTLYINGMASSYIIGSAEVSRDQSTVTVPLSKGDVIYWDRSASIFKSSAFYSFKGNGSLYFYVGETVQNANLINAGRIEEKLVGKLDRSDVKAYIVETYLNGTSGYNVWSNGYCEQWGRIARTATGNMTINLLISFKDTNYHPSTSSIGGAGNNLYEAIFTTLDTSSFTISLASGTHVSNTILWKATGYVR